MPHKSYLKLQLFAGFAVKQIQGSVKQIEHKRAHPTSNLNKKNNKLQQNKQIWDVAFGMKETFLFRIPMGFFSHTPQEMPPNQNRSPWILSASPRRSKPKNVRIAPGVRHSAGGQGWAVGGCVGSQWSF